MGDIRPAPEDLPALARPKIIPLMRPGVARFDVPVLKAGIVSVTHYVGCLPFPLPEGPFRILDDGQGGTFVLEHREPDCPLLVVADAPE